MDGKNLPVSADQAAGQSISFKELKVDQQVVYWVESRPSEKGRRALMKMEKGKDPVDLFPTANVHSKIHEYGGASFAVKAGHLVFYDAYTCSLFYQNARGSCVCLAQDTNWRWADFSFSPCGEKLLCVLEDHHGPSVINSIVCIDLLTHQMQTMHAEYDFYASPRWNFDGTLVGFIHWSFPHMPWDQSGLHVISYEGKDSLDFVGEEKEAISEFLWLDDGSLLYASDRSGFSNLYLRHHGKEKCLFPIDGDCSFPLWVLGRTSFDPMVIEGKSSIVTRVCIKGVDQLCIVPLDGSEVRSIECSMTVVESLATSEDEIYVLGGSEDATLSVMSLRGPKYRLEGFYPNKDLKDLFESVISRPQELSCLSSFDGAKVYGFYYPPTCNGSISGDLPPLILKCHSGPTNHAQKLLQWPVQYWTSRGFAYLEVNYRGSTGYGREYQQALNGNWGALDVRDCIDLMEHSIQKGWVDPERIFARGSSSGGFTALLLAAFSQRIKGCVSLYGVTELTSLVSETHKFEKYYLDTLIGPIDQCLDLYEKRSPLHQSSKIQAPVLFFHGDRDTVVPLSQAKKLHSFLGNSELVTFEGEGHGFRSSDTIRSCLELELAFYQNIMEK